MNELRTDPNWVFENSEFIQDWGPYVLAEAAAIHEGVTPPMLTPSPEVGLSKQTVDEYFNAQDQPITLPALCLTTSTWRRPESCKSSSRSRG